MTDSNGGSYRPQQQPLTSQPSSQPYSHGPPPLNDFPTTPTGSADYHHRPILDRPPESTSNLRMDSRDPAGSNNAAHPDVLDLLGTYPFIQYTPSSRVARHLQTLNLTQSPTDRSHPSSIYPQYARTFEQLDRGGQYSASVGPGASGWEGPRGQLQSQYRVHPDGHAQKQSQSPMQMQTQTHDPTRDQHRADPPLSHLSQPRQPALPMASSTSYPYTDRQVWEINRQAALGYMDHWGGHVGQPNRSTAGQSQGQGQGQGQAGRQQLGMESNYGIGNGSGNGNGQGMRAGSWKAGVRETIDLTGSRNGNTNGNGYENGGRQTNSNGTGDSRSPNVPHINPFTEFQQRVVPPYQQQQHLPLSMSGTGSGSGSGPLPMSTGFGLSAGPESYHSTAPHAQPQNSTSGYQPYQPYPLQQNRPTAIASSSSSGTGSWSSRQGSFPAEQSGPFLDGYLAEIQAKQKADREQERARVLVQEQHAKERLDREKARPAMTSTAGGRNSVSVSPRKRRAGEDEAKTEARAKTPKNRQSVAAAGTRLVPFVEIPVKRPVKLGGYRSLDEESDDDEDEDEDEDDDADGDYGGDYDMERSTRRRRLSDSGMAMMTPGANGTPSRRTGFTSAAKSAKKDHHKSLYRFVEDIFEAEDAFPADLVEEDLKASRVFDRLTERARQDDKALLSRSTVERLSVLFKQCTRTTRDRRKRGLTRTVEGEDGDVPENLTKWETDELSRLVGILQRSMSEAEGVAVFVNDGYGARADRETHDELAPEKGKPAKKKRRPIKVEPDESTATVDAAKAGAVTKAMDLLVDAVLAAECTLSMLTADDLAKPLYSEDVIRETLDCASTTVNDVLLPFLDALSGTSNIQSSVLAHISTQTDDTARTIRLALANLAKATSRFLHRLTRLIAHEGLSLPESLVYRTTQLAVQLVFVIDPIVESKVGTAARATAIWKEAMDGQAGTKTLKGEAMDVLKTLYIVQGSAEREEMLREVLGFTAKVAELKRSQAGYRTRKGKTIHFVSALLLELMQNCAYGVRDMLEASDVTEMMEMDGDAAESKPATKLNTSALSAYMDEMDRSAQFILQYMLNKLSSGNVGKQKSSLEANYKVLLETFLEDQVEVLYMPEFPAAAISLGITARTLISILEENKPTAENATIRGIAIDHLGVLISALREYEMKYTGGEAPMDLRKIVQKGKHTNWTTLRDANRTVLQTLQKNSSQNGLYNSAADVMTARWLLELHKALRQESPEAGVDGSSDMEVDQDPSPIMREIQAELIRTSRKTDDDSVFAHAQDDLLAQADRPCISVEMARPLQAALGLIFKAILTCMSAPIVAHRTKAIRALGAAIAVDPTYLSRSDIRKSIQDRISDSSPAVRDAAIDLVGRYVPDKPDVALEYYPSISGRIADTGPAVRKRVIKLFRVIYDLVHKRSIRIEICCKLVGLVDDEEDSVKDLALVTLRSIWFPQDTSSSSAQARRSETPASTTSSKDAGETTIHPLVDVVARYSNDMIPVELAIREISKADMKNLGQEYSRLIGAMLDRLMSYEDRTAAETLPLVRSIHLLSSARPESMDLQRATSLLPYLRQATTPDEVVLCETLMRIFRLSIPSLPKTASNFAIELSKTLLPMIAKPAGKLGTLEEAVMCYSATVMHLSQEYGRIITILRSCLAKLRGETSKALKRPERKPLDQKTLPFIASIATLLVSQSSLDTVRLERSEVDDFIWELTEGPISTFMFETLLGLWDLDLDQVMRHAIIQCFGHLYRAYPTLMTDKRSITVMDSVLTGGSTNQQTTLKMLTLIYETLATLVDNHPNDLEQDRPGDKPRRVDMDQLIGDTAGFAESGVGSAIIQRYIDKVLHAALSRYDDIQKVAIDILSLTINQGLAHPIQSFPIIVTLETSEYIHVSEKAFALHTHLQAKHASIINSRYFESAKVVFDHRRNIDENVLGYRNPDAPTALMDRWYSLIRDKRAVRQDFLKAMCKAFSFDASPRDVTWDDVLLARFMAENISLLDFKVQEEVLQIIAAMTALLAGLGMQVVEIVNSVKIAGQQDDLLGQAKLVRDAENDDDMDQDDSQASKIEYDIESLVNATAMVGIIVLLKTRLKKTYSLTEDKVNKFIPGKKSAASDRPATRKITDGSGGLPDWHVLPGVKKRVETVSEYQDQVIAFMKLIEEDGTMRPEYSGDENEEED